MFNFEIFKDMLPVGDLAIIALKSCPELGKKVDDHIVGWRSTRDGEHLNSLHFAGYVKDTYLLEAECSRFGSGEGKATIEESVRGKDLYILADITNHSVTYKMGGFINHMSPDDHYADIKRVIAATMGRARRINVIMPFLYESRQHKRAKRESLDCAIALQELLSYGVDNIVTFDAHDPRVANAIPRNSFDNIQPTYQFVKALCKNITDLKFDKDHLMIISPDEGAMDRSVFYANVLGVNVGMFYKRRDYSKVVNGRNPIIEHTFLGESVEGKDVIIVDDMISSGESMLDVAGKLKKMHANRVFCVSTFGLFTNGFEAFDKAYEEGIFDRVLTTNVCYQQPEALEKPYYISVDCSKYIALFIEALNHDIAVSALLDPIDKIKILVNNYKKNNGHLVYNDEGELV